MKMEKKQYKLLIVLTIQIIACAIFGFFLCQYVWNSSVLETSRNAVISAKIAASGLNGSGLQELAILPDAINQDEYDKIKMKLQEIQDTNNQVRFAYVYTEQNGKIYIIADSEAPGSKDYSPYKQEYAEAGSLFKTAFTDGRVHITKPSTDRWGEWVSVISPIINKETDKVIVAFAMDYSVDAWFGYAKMLTTLTAIIMALITIVLATFHVIIFKNKRLKDEQIRLSHSNIETQKAIRTFTDMFEKNKSIMLIVDWETGLILDYNNAAFEFYGYTVEEFKGLNIKELDTLSDAEIEEKMILIKNEERTRFEVKHRLASGEIRYVEVSLSTLEKDNRTVIYSIINDISRRKRTEDALLKSEEKFRAIFEAAPFGIGIFNTNTGFAYEINGRYSEIVGRPIEELRALNWIDYTHPDDLEESIKTSRPFKDGEINGYNLDKRFVKPDDSYVWVNLAVTSFADVIKGIHICMIEDISDSKKKEEEVIYLSYHDAMTGLYNRSYFEEEIKRFELIRNSPISLIMGDVNGLKTVNDSLGHAQGDILLQEIAKVLKSCCREEDVICRIGGDEFVIMLSQAGDNEAESACQRIYKGCETFNENKTHDQPNLSISLGHATRVNKDQIMNEILKQADEMLYIRKNLDHVRLLKNETNI